MLAPTMMSKRYLWIKSLDWILSAEWQMTKLKGMRDHFAIWRSEDRTQPVSGQEVTGGGVIF